LAVVRAHPVDGHRCKPSLLAFAGEAKPPATVLGRHGRARAGLRPTIAQDSLFDKEDGVLNGRSTLHFPALDGGWMNHPNLPESAPGVEKAAVTRISCGVGMHQYSLITTF